MTILVYCSTRFEGVHCWPDAPDEVEFLRHPHRHEFHVTAWRSVLGTDRDVEFLLLKREVGDEIDRILQLEDVLNWSCERWAVELLRRLNLDRCEVSEDGENGALVMR